MTKDKIIMVPSCGDAIADCIHEAIETSFNSRVKVEFVFNDTPVVIDMELVKQSFYNQWLTARGLL